MFALRKFFTLSSVFRRELRGKILPLTRGTSPTVLATSLRDSSQISQQHTLGDFKSESSFTEAVVPASWDEVGEATDADTAAIISRDFIVYRNFVTEEEEKSILDEIEPYLKRLKYEENHWDDAILGFRETEKKTWSQKNRGIFDRLRALAFPPGTIHLPYVHVLDLKATGVIKAHVDSIKFCGSTVSGISLLSDAVMKLVNEKDKTCYANVLLSRRSLYIMRNRARYEYTHEVLGGEFSRFRGVVVPKERRIAVICRNEPPLADGEE